MQIYQTSKVKQRRRNNSTAIFQERIAENALKNHVTVFTQNASVLSETEVL